MEHLPQVNPYNYGYCLPDGQREIIKSIYDSENDVRTHLDASTNTLAQGQANTNSNVNHVSRDVLNAQFGTAKEIADVRQEIAQNRYQLSQVNNDINKEICGVRESLNDKFAIILLESQKANSSTREELLKGFASTQLDACKNTSELARQIAECCCETQKALLTQSASIRELDLKQSAQTRELALTIENNRLRDKCDNQDRHSRGNEIEIAITNVLRSLNTGKN